MFFFIGLVILLVSCMTTPVVWNIPLTALAATDKKIQEFKVGEYTVFSYIPAEEHKKSPVFNKFVVMKEQQTIGSCWYEKISNLGYLSVFEYDISKIEVPDNKKFFPSEYGTYLTFKLERNMAEYDDIKYWLISQLSGENIWHYYYHTDNNDSLLIDLCLRKWLPVFPTGSSDTIFIPKIITIAGLKIYLKDDYTWEFLQSDTP